MYTLRTDYSILEGPYYEDPRDIVADIQASGLDITKEGDIKNFLVVNIDKVESETYYLSQPQLINQIVSDLVLSQLDATPRNIPALTTNILEKCQSVEKFD